jgi:glycine betaine/proline transport system ATP-binding protein
MDRELLKVSPETPLYDVLDPIARTKLPVAVTDQAGHLKGVLIKGSVLAGLAGTKKGEEPV